MKHIPNYKQYVDSIKESLVTEAKFFRLPNKLNAMWELKNSVDYIVGKHSNGDDYNPAEMKTIEEFIKKIKKSAKAFKDSEEVKGTIYESVNEAFTSKDKLLQKEFTKKQWDKDWNPFIYDGKIIIDTKPGQDISDDYGSTLKRTDILDDLLKKYHESGKINYDTYAEYYQFPGIHPAIFFTYNELVQWAKKGFKPQNNYPPTAMCLLYGKGCPTNKSVNEASLRIEAYPEDDSLIKLLKKHNIKIKIVDEYGPQGIPEVELTGNKKDLEKLVAAKDDWGWAKEYIEESAVTESAMSELDLLAKEAKDFKSFTKEVFKEFKNLPKKPDTLKWLEELYNDAINEAEKAEGDRSKLSAEIEKALNDKATESGVPIGLLRLVMRRGLDAWNSSHREGVPQVAWGYARVNAFLEKGKGTWGKADADIAKEVRDEGKAGKLPIKNPSEFTKKQREA